MSNAVAAADLAALHEKTAGLPEIRISEVVLQTAQFERMTQWYEAVLGNSWSVINTPKDISVTQRATANGNKQVRASDVRSSFMFIDRSLPYGQLFAIFEIPFVGASPTTDPGLNHMQFKHVDIPALIERVKLLEEHEIVPHRCSNHGPITSFYFYDPDKNIVELCSNNFQTQEAFLGYFQSEAYRSNPSGIELDYKEFIARFDSGAPIEELVRIP
ncbi:hypothetical protein [Pusillimonas noertemannii]|uniref:Catechol 2,3-dioxygenase-like lactoylglutathione lyase family enzyme n=1 Tax=Pusillimonas noertemannii TaxID=305977 RepID=A0A2U1CJY3_9BURK|nr:hypothetical protein [Pusillimonas noertemannii]NYT69757.1 hypothetical protein [Pusillimonas noertemannii]PVY61319.1 catechol 2,3-dioxygenase-like lactoylglutathione lyase family enzyme [Pusillimonas noertemannii]TFL09065.1 hypothetical protein CSC72_14885 [Pusillimonas noertemannii]